MYTLFITIAIASCTMDAASVPTTTSHPGFTTKARCETAAATWVKQYQAVDEKRVLGNVALFCAQQ